MYDFLRSFVLLLLFAVTTTAQNSTTFWEPVKAPDAQAGVLRSFVPDQYHTIAVDLDALRTFLAGAPTNDEASALTLQLPSASGEPQRFRVWRNRLLPPALNRHFPSIQTFSGVGIDDAYARLKLDLTPQGLHVMVLTPEGDWYIDPYWRKHSPYHQVYHRKDYTAAQNFLCHTGAEIVTDSQTPQGPNPIGGELRTYRLAVAATGEYTAYQGGTVEGTMAAIATTINRVNGVYERDMAITMELVDSNHLLIFFDGTTDPYSGGSGSRMGQNQDVLDDSIGIDNYDIGHVFDLGTGGIASLQSVCNSNRKAQGFTGRPDPVGDPFDIDYVAHEIGHQFGGNHTFNNCNGQGFRPYEPGSGSTVMAYAGLCGSNNVAPNSDAHFHVANFDEIISYSVVNNGNTCPLIDTIDNTPPIVDAGVGGWVIPISTPFELTGSATDAEDTTLTYCWEQYDLGPSTPINQPEGNAPLFRSLAPSISPTRVFPRLSNLVNNTVQIGEVLPFYARDMQFRLTVRDNHPAGGGVDYEQITLSVSEEAGPFLVLSQNESTVWTSGTYQVVEWAVANTDQGLVNTPFVDIYLSEDGGYTYPLLLQEAVPNDGSAVVLVPENLSGTTFRVKVKGHDQVFFDINDLDITIQAPTAPGFAITPSEPFQAVCAPDSAAFQLNIAALLDFSDDIRLSIPDLPVGLTAAFTMDTLVAPQQIDLVISGTENVGSEILSLAIVAEGGDTMQTVALFLEVFAGPPASVDLLLPLDGDQNTSITPTFSWEPIAEATTYTLEIATDPAFMQIIAIYPELVGTTLETSVQLVDSTTLFWRVRGSNPVCGAGEDSQVRSFTTEVVRCYTYVPDILPVPFDNLPFLLSRIQVEDAFPIKDINVYNLEGSFFPSGSLVFRLTAPNGASADLIPKLCDEGTSFNISLDDEAPPGDIPCPYQNGGIYRPEEALRTLHASPSNGQWRLSIFDNGNAGQLNLWELELCTSAIIDAVTEPIPGLGNLRVFPNPVDDVLNLEISLEQVQPLHLTMFNAAGQMVKSMPLNQLGAGLNELAVPVHALPAGLYFYQLRTVQGAGQQSGKFVKK